MVKRNVENPSVGPTEPEKQLTKKDNHGFEDGKNLLTNMANNATKLRREYIKNNLECGIYFIGEGHIGEWEKQFLDTEIV